MDKKIRQKIDHWLQEPFDQKTQQKIKALLKKDPTQLEDAFYKNLDFGTGGVRSLMGIGTNRLNIYTIRMAAQGLCNYLKAQSKKRPRVVIGYDNRINSKLFAEEAARVLAANQIQALIFENMRPTPLVSFACRAFECSAAIMITASHNPPEYNGFKIYWDDGAQVLPPHDQGIIGEFLKSQDIRRIPIMSLSHPLIQKIDSYFDEDYIEAIASLQLFPSKKKDKSSLNIVYTNLHGAGYPLAIKALKAWGYTSVKTVRKQQKQDGHFPNALIPNPEEKKALELGAHQMLESSSDLLIATDPDADRMAVVVNHKKKAYIISGNQLACIYAYHICHNLQINKCLPKNGALVKTIVTTELLKKIATSFNLACVDVLTGFKYIAEKISIWEKTNHHSFIFGAEESCGYLLGTQIRDKDGILAACLISEIAYMAKKHQKTLLDLLHDLYRKYGVYREVTTSFQFEDSEEGMDKMQTLMQTLRKNPPKTIHSLNVETIEDFLLQKQTKLIKNNRSFPKLPKSDSLRFWLEDNSKIVIRPSGTEPKIKIYIGVVEKNNRKDLLKTTALADQKAHRLLEDIQKLF